MSDDTTELALQRAWFRAQRAEPVPDDRVHPEDDMYNWSEAIGFELAGRRAEYMRSGYEALQVLRNLLRAGGRPLPEVPRMLDFACGYGRLTRFLVRELAPERVVVADVLRGAVDFVRETFGVDGFYSATDPGDLRIEGRYPLIWVGSLFSHLPRSRFAPFLARLYGALEPDGMLVFSTHGPHALPEAERDPSGFTFQRQSESANLDLEEYGATFVAPPVVEAIAREAGVAALRSLPYELWRIQDLYVASPGDLSALDAWRPAPVLRGGITHCEVDGSGHARIGGWVRTPSWAAPVDAVELFVGEGQPIDTTLVPFAGTLPAREGGERFRQFDWFVEGPSDGIPPGNHTLCAVARTSAARDAFASKILRKP